MLLMIGCGSTPVTFGPDLIRIAMADQQKAWNAGDIKSFMIGYSDTICFINSKGTTCGREAVTANYERSYPDREAMGHLEFGIDEIIPAGEKHAWVTGTWALERTADTLNGGFSLLWVKEKDTWRIVRDHTY